MNRALATALAALAGCRTEDCGRLTRGGPPPEDAPNVLLVSLDTVRRDHLSPYGYDRDTTPGLKRVAARGALFTYAWSQSPVTDGTHASLFTGRLQSDHGKFNHSERLGDAETTMAEYFRSIGYRTFGLASSGKFVEESGFAQGFEGYRVFRKVRMQKRTGKVVAAAMEEMEGSEPWFGFLHFIDAHAPYLAPEPYTTTWLRSETNVDPRATQALIREQKRGAEPLDADTIRTLEGLYDGELTWLDTQLEPVWDRVSTDGERSTLVVITADHGEGFQEHGYVGHGRYLYEELLRVPLVFWWPGRIAAGTVVDRPAQTVDVFPTVVDLVGAEPPPGLAGRSFAAELRHGTPTDLGDGTIVVQATHQWGIMRDFPEGRFKLVVTLEGGKTELCRYATDPTCTIDVGAQHPAIRDDLLRRLTAIGLAHPNARSIHRDDFSDDEMEELKELGYVE